MLRSLGRKGVADRCQLSAQSSCFDCPVCSWHIHYNSHPFVLYRRTIYQHPCFLPSRYLSTPSSTTSKSLKDEPTAHTPIPPAPHKTKVELRPGPIKPLTVPSGSHPSKVKQAQTTNVSPLQPTSPTAARTESIAEAVKEDFKQAYIHGVLARPPPNAGKIATLWHQVKELFKFYLRGLKMVVTHYWRANEIQARVKAGGEPLSRWESRFIQTNRTDLARLVPFVAIVLILEEVIPLIVLYAPGMLPSTCVLTSQRERIEAKRREKQRAFTETMREVFLDVRKAGPAALTSSLPGNISGIALCGLLSLSTWGPNFRRRSRLERHMQSIVADDALLAKEGMGDRLTHPELLEALEERGIVTDGLNTTALKSRLRWWLTIADKTDEGSPVSRRIDLAARSALGQF
ncbi:hypothetical protein EDB92DRAFT_159415 [Lactarius akahatsu]|uniref:Letm1 RBD domain-containing protein n=1 Tax=Lactarius akahatsu TaxID=416441 RepID=A0AAD4LL14_9AGAM|nr:hypothetical protein EDB92DRAFT_159415 [Lactarius akahatsu]